MLAYVIVVIEGGTTESDLYSLLATKETAHS